MWGGVFLQLHAIFIFLLFVVVKHQETEDFAKCCENMISESTMPKAFTV